MVQRYIFIEILANYYIKRIHKNEFVVKLMPWAKEATESGIAINQLSEKGQPNPYGKDTKIHNSEHTAKQFCKNDRLNEVVIREEVIRGNGLAAEDCQFRAPH